SPSNRRRIVASRPSAMTLADLAIRARRYHRVTQRAVNSRVPANQAVRMTPGIAADSVDPALAFTSITLVAGGTTVRISGWPTDSSMIVNRRPASAGSSQYPSTIPRRLRTAKGIRNFAEAANHNAYLTGARLLRSARVVSAHTTANAVDCHR